jgi:hypothetical protein
VTEVSRAVDPLKFCVAATVAAIAWLVTPALAVAVFASLGIVAYWKAYRRGLLRSRCLIGDTRLVLVYLLALGLGGLILTVARFA